MCFAYQPEEVTPGHLAEDLQCIRTQLGTFPHVLSSPSHPRTTGSLGASILSVGPNDSLEHATFVVCSFDDAQLAQRAASAQLTVVSWFYVLDCIKQRRRVPITHTVRVLLFDNAINHPHTEQGYYSPLHVPGRLPADSVASLYCTFTSIKVGASCSVCAAIILLLQTGCAACARVPVAHEAGHRGVGITARPSLDPYCGRGRPRHQVYQNCSCTAVCDESCMCWCPPNTPSNQHQTRCSSGQHSLGG